MASASTPEMRFIKSCLFPEAQKLEGTTANLAQLDWPRLFWLASFHGMLPLVSTRLEQLPEKSSLNIPKHAISDLEIWRTRHISRTLTLTAALIELQREFDRRNLPVVSWKGPSIALLLYGSSILRETSDLDFLLREEDLAQVQELTGSLGYTLLGQNESEGKSRYTFAHQHEFEFLRSRDKILLEFHVQIMTARFPSWQDSQTYIPRATTHYPLANTQLLLQCPEDLLVSLCVHAIKHNWDRMKWSCDIAQFLRVYGAHLDWKEFLASLTRARKHPIVLLGLSLASILFDIQLPPEVEKALQRTPNIFIIATELADHMMGGSAQPVPSAQAVKLIALLCPRLRDRMVYRFQPTFHLEYEDLYFSENNRLFFFLNYPYRILRLLRQHGLQRLVALTAISMRSGQ